MGAVSAGENVDGRVGVDVPGRYVDAPGPGEGVDRGVRAGEGVDAVVMLTVRERAELVEERTRVTSADQTDEVVLCVGRDGESPA
jgi:hypothetical protein